MKSIQGPPHFCEERRRLDDELRMLLAKKTELRESVAGEAILNPAERRATLVQTDGMIDDVIALMNEHKGHCSCERQTTTGR